MRIIRYKGTLEIILYRTLLYSRILVYRSRIRLKSLLKYYLYNFNIASNLIFNSIK
jgi:hypothetical protein